MGTTKAEKVRKKEYNHYGKWFAGWLLKDEIIFVLASLKKNRGERHTNRKENIGGKLKKVESSLTQSNS